MCEMGVVMSLKGHVYVFEGVSMCLKGECPCVYRESVNVFEAECPCANWQALRPI